MKKSGDRPSADAPHVWRIAFRTDASSLIGSGHVLRCLSLAEAFRKKGHDCAFVCRPEKGHLVDLVRKWGFPCVLVDGEPGGAAEAMACVSALRSVWSSPPSLYVVDHYKLCFETEEVLKRHAPVMVIDDLVDRPHDCDVLLDMSHSLDEGHHYDDLVPAGCRRLVGQKYLLLRDEFTTIAQAPRANGPVSRVLMTFGGNDPLDYTSLALDALAPLAATGIALDIMTGLSNPRAEALQAKVARLPGVRLFVQHPRPSDLMRAADLCLAAGGMTVWECCYLGLPMLVVRMADNQIHGCEIVGRHGAARVLGTGWELGAERLAFEVRAAMADDEWRRTSSRAGQELVDGKGIARIVEALEGLLSGHAVMERR